MGTFRLGIVGAGLITQGSHLPAALSCPEVLVTAIVDPAIDRASAMARNFGIAPRVAGSVSEVMDNVDGFIIATPNHTHFPLAKECVTAGRPVLVEKPLANSSSQAEELVALAARTNVAIAVGYSSRFRNNVVLLKKLLDQRHFGHVRRFVHQFGSAGGWAPLSGYNLDRTLTGGGVLVVTGTHFLDRMLYLWGEPSEVRLWDDSLGGPEANCTARFNFHSPPESTYGMARYSKTGRLDAGLAIETDRGVIVLEDTDEAEIRFRPHGSDLEHQVHPRRPEPQHDVFMLQIRDFVESCRTGCAPRVDARQGLASVRLIERLYTTRTSLVEDWYGAGGLPQ